MWFLHIGSAYPLLGQRMANTVGYEGAIGGVIHMLKLAPAATPVMAAGRRRMMRPPFHHLAIGIDQIARSRPGHLQPIGGPAVAASGAAEHPALPGSAPLRDAVSASVRFNAGPRPSALRAAR